MQNFVCKRDKLCINHWIVRTLSNYAEMANYAQNYAHTLLHNSLSLSNSAFSTH